MQELEHIQNCRHNIVVKVFNMSDVEDPDIYLAQTIGDWLHSEQGKFVSNYTRSPLKWTRKLDHMAMGYVYYITAELGPEDMVAYRLRWPDKPRLT